MLGDDLPPMEAARGVKDLLTQIRPPPLEDAGLEDCALPPESIAQAFLKAASAVGSRPSFFPAESDEESDSENAEDCVVDPWPQTNDSSDQLLGIQPLPSGPCSSGGDRPEMVGGDVSVGIAGVEELKGDVVVVIGSDELKKEEGKEACVDGLKSLKIGERKEDKGKKDEDRKGPTLVEGYM